MSGIKSLSAKLIVAVVTSLALTLTLAFAFFLRMEREQFHAAMMSETGQISSIVLASLDGAMMANDRGRTVELMRTLSMTNGVDRLMIVNKKGIIALSPSKEEWGEDFSVPGGACIKCHEGQRPLGQAVFAWKKADGVEVFRNLIPILNKEHCRSCHRERFLGILVSDIKTTGMKAHEASQIRRFAFIALVIFTIITACLMMVVSLVINRPIKELVHGTKEMAKGNYDFRIAHHPRDELGGLAQSFNQMAEKIDHARSILERWNVSLEEEVERRTEDLTFSNQQLEKEKNLNESISRSIVEGVLAIDREGCIILANAAVASIFGQEEISLPGMPVADLMKLSWGRFGNGEKAEGLLVRSGEGADGVLGEIEQIQPHRRMFKVSRSRIKGPREDDRGWVYSFHDISREKEIDEIKTNLVAMVSHELRTPLTAIKGALSLIAGGRLAEGRERQEFEHIALTNTDRLIELISNLLDLSRIESGSIFYEYGSFRLKPLLERCIASVSTFADRNSVRIVTTVDPEVDEINGDASKIEQVMVNLLSNAVKFSPGGGEVHITAASFWDEFLIGVSDRGIGIPPEERSKIFDKFYQVDMTPVRKIGGSGLGLAISKAIVESHGGRIWVESELNHGSKFFFTLPKARARQAEKAGPLLPDRKPAEERIAQRILVVEDEEAVRKIITRHLEEKGFEVLQAGSAREALDLARTRRPDCITVDVLLPDISGLDLTAVLKSDPATKRIPVIFITLLEGEKVRGMDLGAAGYFTKPVAYGEVVGKIESLIGRAAGSGGPCILLADDEPDVIRPLGTYLAKKGYDVKYAFSGAAALEMARRERPAILILDLRMPEMTGYEVLRKFKDDPDLALIPIIVVTASESDRSRSEVIRLGAAAYLRKPIYPENLFLEIEKIIQ